MNAFSKAVFDAVRQVPYGRVSSYRYIALYIGHPRGARAVGTVLRSCRDPQVPCHRILRQDGSLSPGYSPQLPGLQRALLEGEGVPFLPDGRVDLEACLWDGR